MYIYHPEERERERERKREILLITSIQSASDTKLLTWDIQDATEKYELN